MPPVRPGRIGPTDLDLSTAAVRPLSSPPHGWLRAVREALGWPRRVVAAKLDVSPAAVRDYEKCEVGETISLGTLRRAAGALGCDLVIALVPTGSRTFRDLAAMQGAAAEPAPDRARADSASVHAKRQPPQSVSNRTYDDGDLEPHLK